MFPIRPTSGFALAGSEASLRRSARRLAIFALLLCCAPVWAQPGGGLEPPLATSSIRIELPAGTEAPVSLALELDRVLLELPRGAVFPSDFVAASNGMLAASSTRSDGETILLDLELSAAAFDRVIYEPDALILQFRSRYAEVDAFGDANEQYLLGIDDRILVRVHNHEDLTGPVVIDRQGRITLAHVGDVRAAGLTPRQLEANLTDVLSGILVSPRVDVEVEEYRSQWVSVGGEVNRMGRVVLRGGTQLKEVLAEAGGFTEYAGESVTISRKIDDSPETVMMVINRTDYETGKKNPRLKHGDIIEVKRAKYCYIQGEVRESSRVRIERGMSLLRVISLAGGLTDWADRKSIKVRDGDGGNFRERTYNLKKILNGKEEDPVMIGGEMIIVPKRFL
jgi:polysaccharide export outer membrane protein